MRDMARGRKPKPTALKRLAGNPGRRPLNEAEPTPRPVAPKKPPHLTGLAGRTWKWLCEILGGMGILASSDVALMTLYCDTWQEYVDTRKAVKKYGLVMVSPKTKMPFINPYANAEAMLKKQLLSCLGELGLSPSSRSRIHTSTPAEPAGVERLFNLVG